MLTETYPNSTLLHKHIVLHCTIYALPTIWRFYLSKLLVKQVQAEGEGEGVGEVLHQMRVGVRRLEVVVGVGHWPVMVGAGLWEVTGVGPLQWGVVAAVVVVQRLEVPEARLLEWKVNTHTHTHTHTL